MDLIYFSVGKRYMVELGYRGPVLQKALEEPFFWKETFNCFKRVTFWFVSCFEQSLLPAQSYL